MAFFHTGYSLLIVAVTSMSGCGPSALLGSRAQLPRPKEAGAPRLMAGREEGREKGVYFHSLTVSRDPCGCSVGPGRGSHRTWFLALALPLPPCLLFFCSCLSHEMS